MPSVDVLLKPRSHSWTTAWLRPEQDRTGPAQSTVTIMVVDDDERGRRLTSRMLRDEGYMVIEAGSAEQALERMAEAGAVQLLLTDIVMPGMNGVELAEKVYAAEPSQRIVLMSGYDRYFPKWGEMGARFPLLTKPFTVEQLLVRVQEALKGGMH